MDFYQQEIWRRQRKNNVYYIDCEQLENIQTVTENTQSLENASTLISLHEDNIQIDQVNVKSPPQKSKQVGPSPRPHKS